MEGKNFIYVLRYRIIKNEHCTRVFWYFWYHCRVNFNLTLNRIEMNLLIDDSKNLFFFFFDLIFNNLIERYKMYKINREGGKNIYIIRLNYVERATW